MPSCAPTSQRSPLSLSAHYGFTASRPAAHGHCALSQGPNVLLHPRRGRTVSVPSAALPHSHSDPCHSRGQAQVPGCNTPAACVDPPPAHEHPNDTHPPSADARDTLTSTACTNTLSSELVRLIPELRPAPPRRVSLQGTRSSRSAFHAAIACRLSTWPAGSCGGARA